MKDTNNKSKCTKKRRLTAAELAEMFDCSESYVNQVRQGVKGKNSRLAKQIRYADEVVGNSLGEVSNQLIDQIKSIVKV